MTAPIIVTGTNNDDRYVMFWATDIKVHGLPPTPVNVASMHTTKAHGLPMLRIDDWCPPEWVDLVLATFDAHRKGGVVVPTHELSWKFGHAEFTPLTSEVPDDEPTTLDGLEVDA